MSHFLPLRPAPAYLLLVLAVAGCSVTDPYQRPGNWRPMNANAMNLELQVARPSDLAQGRGITYSDGDTAAQAVDRMRHDKVKVLQAPTTSDVGTGTATSGGS